MPKGNGDTARKDAVAALAKLLDDAAAQLMHPSVLDAKLLIRPQESGFALSWDSERLNEWSRIIGECRKVVTDLALAETVGPAGAPTSARASARSITRPPPIHLVVLVLIWLILVVGPVAEGKLPDEIQTMLGTEVGTVALALTITQMMKDKRK